MTENEKLQIDLDEDRLPTIYRTMKVPSETWESLKRVSEKDGMSLRDVIDTALDEELFPLIERLRELGLKAEIDSDKLCRVPLDDNIIGRINYARRQTGLSAISLLRLSFNRYVANDP